MSYSTHMRAHVYEPLWKCMYCGSEEPPLGKEHLIPESLNGALVLPRSVCKPCETLTGEYEQQILNADFLVPRLLLELRRKDLDRKPSKKLPLMGMGRNVDPNVDPRPAIQLDADEHPEVFWVMKMEPAGRLVGIDRAEESYKPFEVMIFRFPMPGLKRSATAQEAARRGGWTVEGKFHGGSFAYSLIKWAYGFAVSERGLDCCETSEILEVLLRRRADVYNFVGCIFASERHRVGHLHRMEIRERGGWLTVVVHLFASLGVPAFEVVIGRLIYPLRNT